MTTGSCARVANVSLLLSFLAFGSGTRSAFCQELPAASNLPSEDGAAERRRTEAKAKYDQGADAYGTGRYEDAVELFLAADKLWPSAPLSFNVARAEEKLGNTAGALRWYRDYLRRAPAVQNATQVRIAIANLSAILEKKALRQLTVLSSPAGASVVIDDQPAVVAPWTGELRPGRHHLSFTRTGYADAQRDVELTASEPIDVSVQLEKENAVAATKAKQPESANTPGASPASQTAARGPGLGILPWVTLGVGGAALGGALTFELLRRSAENDAKHANQVDYQAQLDREHSRQTAARIFLGVGGGLVAAGGVMLLFHTEPKSHLAGARLICLPRICAASALGRF
jgi:tetratricopeptide (TPR) repeat protein